jgi:hypothetical protein
MIACAAALALRAQAAYPAGVRAPFPVAVRARIDVELLAAEEAGEWNVTSRSPGDESRFMLDLTAGNDAYGVAYLKGASSWHDADDAPDAFSSADQGDYLHLHVGRFGARGAPVRRRAPLFTGELEHRWWRMITLRCSSIASRAGRCRCARACDLLDCRAG